ncbi:MAG: hypothetical protein RLZZ15_103 [Verrucomicrobiota bacterium]
MKQARSSCPELCPESICPKSSGGSRGDELGASTGFPVIGNNTSADGARLPGSVHLRLPESAGIFPTGSPLGWATRVGRKFPRRFGMLRIFHHPTGCRHPVAAPRVRPHDALYAGVHFRSRRSTRRDASSTSGNAERGHGSTLNVRGARTLATFPPSQLAGHRRGTKSTRRRLCSADASALRSRL